MLDMSTSSHQRTNDLLFKFKELAWVPAVDSLHFKEQQVDAPFSLKSTLYIILIFFQRRCSEPKLTKTLEEVQYARSDKI